MKIGTIFMEQAHLQLFCNLKVIKGCLFCISLFIVVASWQLLKTWGTKGRTLLCHYGKGDSKWRNTPTCFKDAAKWPIAQVEKSFQLSYSLPSGHAGTLVICFAAPPKCVVLTIWNHAPAFSNQGINSLSRNYCCALQIQQFHLTVDGFSHVTAYEDYSSTFPDLEH